MYFSFIMTGITSDDVIIDFSFPRMVPALEGEGQVLRRQPVSVTRDRDAEAGDVTIMLLHS